MDELENVYKLNKYFLWILIKKYLNIRNIVSYLKVKNASFNYKDIKDPIYCNDHKLEGMIDVKN